MSVLQRCPSYRGVRLERVDCIIIIIIQLTQVFAGEDPSSTMAVMFDVFGSLLVITNNKYVVTAHSPVVQCLL